MRTTRLLADHPPDLMLEDGVEETIRSILDLLLEYQPELVCKWIRDNCELELYQDQEVSEEN